MLTQKMNIFLMKRLMSSERTKLLFQSQFMEVDGIYRKFIEARTKKSEWGINT